MAYAIKKQFLANQILYKLWFDYRRSKSGDKVALPKSGDRLYFDGYPRSGNTYVAGLMKFIFPDAIQSSHLHAIAPLKIALKNKVPVLIIFRDPENSVASNHFRKTDGKQINMKLLNEQLLEYIDYYKFVLHNKKKIQIINFEQVIGNPANFLNGINKIVGFTENETITEQNVASYDSFMKDREKQKKAVNGSLPNDQRNAYKESVIQSLQKNPNYPKAKEIYHKLKQESFKF